MGTHSQSDHGLLGSVRHVFAQGLWLNKKNPRTYDRKACICLHVMSKHEQTLVSYQNMSKLGTSQKNASITVERGRLKKCDSQHVNSPDSPVETATLQETNISHIGKAGKCSTEK